MTRAPLPSREVLADQSGLIRPPWMIWFRNLRDDVSAAPIRGANPVTVTGKTAAIGTTPIPSDPLSAGLYRVTTFLRVTTAATVSSSVGVVIGFTSGGVACQFTGALLTANLANQPQSLTWLLKIDNASPITYATSYASNVAGMTYELSVTLETVSV